MKCTCLSASCDKGALGIQVYMCHPFSGPSVQPHFIYAQSLLGDFILIFLGRPVLGLCDLIGCVCVQSSAEEIKALIETAAVKCN